MELHDGRKRLYIDIPGMSSPNPHAREEVYSPMTELTINFQNSCTSHCSTPRRRLSLNTPTKQTLSLAESMESGIDTCVESPCSSHPSRMNYMVDSPSFFAIRPFTRSQSSSSAMDMSLRKRLALQSQFSITDVLSNRSPQSKARKITLPNLKLVADSYLENDTGSHPELLARSPESEEVAALTFADTEMNLSCSETNRSFSAPPVLDSVERYFTDLENPSLVSCDDGFSEFEEHDYEGDQAQEISSAVAGLISAPLIKKMEDASPEDSLGELNSSKMALFRPKPNVTFAKPAELPVKKRSVSFSVKRADPPRDVSPIIRKRLRLRSKSLIGSDQTVRSPLATVSPNLSPGRFGRSLSLDSPRNKAVIQLLGENEANLVGDGSESHCFPTFIGRNEDLKAISCETLKEALEGKYDGTISNLMIIDCRYPYEYRGGHIKDAINIFTKEDLTDEFLRKPKCAGQRLAIVFHCEFSSQRGPAMYRFLRNKDRDIHRHCYPKLHYPELYLLEGGYKEFYSKCKEYCEPQGYLCMHDENYSQELKHFMKRSKSWTEGNWHRRTGLRY